MAGPVRVIDRAEEIVVTPAGNLASANVQDALEELQGDIDGIGGGGASALDDLTDVAITAAASGDILRHNGTAWVDTPGTTHFEAAGAVATHEAAGDPHPQYTTAGELSAGIASHESDTTSVHGIADTSTLYRQGGTDVAVADGGTGAGTAADARTNLGVDYTTLDERTRDVMGAALVAGANITITPNDGADTITITSTATGGGPDFLLMGG